MCGLYNEVQTVALNPTCIEGRVTAMTLSARPAQCIELQLSLHNKCVQYSNFYCLDAIYGSFIFQVQCICGLDADYPASLLPANDRKT